MSTLFEIISAESAKDLGEHLPTEMVDKLNYISPERRREFAASELTLDDFSEMVAEKEGAGVNLEEGRAHAIGVMKIVKEAYGAGSDPGGAADEISDTELDKIRADLPEEFAPLFT